MIYEKLNTLGPSINDVYHCCSCSLHEMLSLLLVMYWVFVKSCQPREVAYLKYYFNFHVCPSLSRNLSFRLLKIALNSVFSLFNIILFCLPPSTLFSIYIFSLIICSQSFQSKGIIQFPMVAKLWTQKRILV